MRCPGWPCDTPYAIFPDQYRDEAQRMSSETLTQLIDGEHLAKGASNICFTGGEPFIQKHHELALVYDWCKNRGASVEYFTNGSVEIPGGIQPDEIIMDWKLQGSGEATTQRETRLANLARAGHVKFVVKDVADLTEAMFLTTYEPAFLRFAPSYLWVAAAWGTISNAEIIEFINQNKMPWRLNVQMHKYIFNPEERGI